MKMIAVIKNTCTYVAISCLVPVLWAAKDLETPTALRSQTKSLLSMSFEQLLEVEVEVASKTSEHISDAPSSVTVFTRQELQGMGIESVETLLNFVPGFIATREIVFGQGYMVAARGRTTPQASYNVLFMLDGQRLNNDRSGGALSLNHFISLHNVKRVEIIRGPGSALYGTSAFAGVVNIITDDELNEAYVSVGEFDSREAYINMSKSGRDWKWSASARYFEDAGDSYAETLVGELDSVRDPRQQQDLYLNVQYQQWKLLLRYHHQSLPDFYLASDISEVNEVQFDSHFARLQYTVFDEALYELKLHTGYSWQNDNTVMQTLSADQVKAATGNEQAALLNGGVSKEREWSLGIEGRYVLNKKHELFAGLDWRQPDNVKDRFASNYRSSSLNQTLDVARGVPSALTDYAGDIQEGMPRSSENSRHIISLYIQDKYQINDQWSATVGTRYDRYSDFGNSVNPRLSMLYALSANTSFKMMYGEAFRAPSRRQLSSVLTGNSQLRPEKIKTVELAWLQTYRDKAQTTLTWFHSRHQDLIDTQLNASNQRIFMNTEEVLTTEGWELEATLEPFKDVILRMAYSYFSATEEAPQRFPQQTFSMMAHYQRDDWHFNLNTYFHDEVEQQAIGGVMNRLAAYWVVNAAVHYQLNPQMTISAKFNNLLNEDYYHSVKPALFEQGIANRGRSFNLGLKYSF